MSGMKFLLAGGGTAGHIEPALAVARALERRESDAEILFLGTQQGLENQLVPAAGFPLIHIPKVRIPRAITPQLLKVPGQLISAVRASMKALDGVDCAIGFGGYVSAPMYCACKIKGIPFLIHEQNAKPGWANRIGAYLTPYRALSYPIARGAISKGVITGLPLRKDVIEALSTINNWTEARNAAKKALCATYGLRADRPLIFIFGGSQGSQAINSVIENSRGLFAERGVSILHGVGNLNEVPKSDENYCATAYISQMAQAYLAADIVISRSGAVTCAEFSALGRFAIFIPLPVGNGEQGLNANLLVSSGRATIVNQSTFSAHWLEANLNELLMKSNGISPKGDASARSAADKIVQIAFDALEA